MSKKITLTGQLPNATTNPSPTIECWIPESNPKGIGLVIFPGGAYYLLAPHEGMGYAEYFSQHGIACFVVTYRLGANGFRHPAMLEDSFAAIHTIRSRSSEFGIDPNRIGVIGSSAGGHLAAHSLVAWNSYQGEVSVRPDFGALCYAVISPRGHHPHTDSFKNLLGEPLTDSRLDEVSCDKLVTEKTPPCFLWHTFEDTCVSSENSMLFASALEKYRIPFELHIYQKCQHGLGLETPHNWQKTCLQWIENIVE